MAAPYDYSLNVESPFEAALGGMKFGATMADLRARQQAAQQQEQARQQAMQQAQDEEAARQEWLAIPSPTMRDTLKYASRLSKDRADALRPYVEMMGKETVQGHLGFGLQVMTALETNPAVGVKMMRERATAARNAGDEQNAKGYETIADMAEQVGPGAAIKVISPMILSLPGGKEAIEGVVKTREEGRAEAEFPAKQERAKAELSKAQAEATAKGVEARFAESKAIQDIEKQGWDIKKIKSDMDIAKQNSRIAAMSASLAKEGNALKRQELELKVQEARQKLDDAVREKVTTASTAHASIDNMLNTADRVLKTPMSIVGAAAGPISARIPTTSQDTADFEELVNTLGSQVTMSRIGEMKGAISDKDLAMLQSSLQSLSLRQSPERLVENVKEAQRLMLKARKDVARKYGVPDSVPDTPAAAPTAGEIDSILKKYGVK